MLEVYLHWLVSYLAIKKGVDSNSLQAITVWNEMKTPWEWQFDDLRAKLWPPRNPTKPDGEAAQLDTFNLAHPVSAAQSLLVCASMTASYL